MRINKWCTAKNKKGDSTRVEWRLHYDQPSFTLGFLDSNALETILDHISPHNGAGGAPDAARAHDVAKL